MNLDERLAALAARAASAHAVSDGFATDGLKARVRRGRRVRAAVVGTAAAMVVGVVGVAAVAAVDAWQVVPPVQTPDPTPDPTPEPTPEPTRSPDPGPTELVPEPPMPAEPLPGWADAGVAPEVFGATYVTDAVAAGGRAVVVGCAADVTGAPTFPAWAAGDATGWTLATGPATGGGLLPCLEQVVAASHGFYAAGTGLYRSADGLAWSEVDLGTDPGAVPGLVDALVAVGDRVTAVVHEGEGVDRRASLWTTLDGVTWARIDDARGRMFDDAGIEAVLPGPDGGALALGADPGGEQIPTAAAWTSSDGLTWTRTTPTGKGFETCRMIDGLRDDEGYVAVGSCEDVPSGVVTWTSVDGATWTPGGASGGAEGELGMATVVTSVPAADGAAGRWATGYGLEQGAVVVAPWSLTWRQAADGAWTRVTGEVALPVTHVEVGGRLVGFWPGDRRDGQPVRVLLAD